MGELKGTLLEYMGLSQYKLCSSRGSVLASYWDRVPTNSFSPDFIHWAIK